MMKSTRRYVGLDVHADTIAVAVAEPDGEVRPLGTIRNDEDAIRRLLKKLGPPEELRVCYEAGPCGFVLYWQLTRLGVDCVVVAPTLVPVKAGDRVKTDRRDAEKLARGLRSGDLTAVWVPDTGLEALRDLLRAREAAKKDQLRARHRVLKFLLRQGRRAPAGIKAWTERHAQWLRALEFDHPAHASTCLDYVGELEHVRDRLRRLEGAIDEALAAAPPALQAPIAALQALRGIAKISAATIVTEVGRLSRFPSPRQLMSYSGAVCSEHSSGSRTRRGRITRAGNAHLRRVVVEAAWAYRHRPFVGETLHARQAGISDEVRAIAWKAQHRLYARYRRLMGRGKVHQQVIMALARELLGFIWAIGVAVERTVPGQVLRAS